MVRKTVSYQSAISSYGALVGIPPSSRATADLRPTVPGRANTIPYDPTVAGERDEAAVAAAQQVLDEFMAAFNARDIAAFEATFNFPSIRLASNRLVTINRGDMHPGMLSIGALAEWHHSAWERRDVIHAGPEKVHVDTRFTRYRADGSVLGSFDSIYVLTCEDGHWGVKIRSSFAP